MPRGDKSKYTNKQKRQAEHIEKGYKKRGVSDKEAEARAWATVNKASGGGKKSGFGRKKKRSKEYIFSHQEACPVHEASWFSFRPGSLVVSYHHRKFFCKFA